MFVKINPAAQSAQQCEESNPGHNGVIHTWVCGRWTVPDGLLEPPLTSERSTLGKRRKKRIKEEEEVQGED